MILQKEKLMRPKPASFEGKFCNKMVGSNFDCSWPAP